MSDFIPSKKTAQDFNDGQQYVGYNPTTQELGDYIEVETVNNLIESALYTQEQADTAVETSNEAKTTADGLNAQIISANQTANSANQAAQGALSEVNQVLADKTLLPDVQKNYYNLGAFDTFVSNGDGTGTITRKTDVYSIATTANVSLGAGVYGYRITTDTLLFNSADTIDINCKINVGGITAVSAYNQYHNKLLNSIAVHSDGVILVTDGIQGRTGSFVVEFMLPTKYQYLEKVVENQTIHIANQNENLYWNNQFKKSLNLCPKKQVQYGELAKLDKGVYTLSLNTSLSNISCVVGFYENGEYNFNTGLNFISQSPITFTLNETKTVALYCASPINDMSIMLNNGTHTYAYTPYNGQIIHEKDLSWIQLFPQDVNPAQTIGGDWEDLGTVTVGTTTLHAYRKVN